MTTGSPKEPIMSNPTDNPFKADLSLVGEEHVKKYLETNGEIGYLWNGVPTLLLTTTGRKSGEKRTIPIIFNMDGENFFLIASKGGAPAHPVWFLNLEANPNAVVQVKGEKWEVKARVAESPERERLWDIALVGWPQYNLYQSRTERKIPVIVLEPVRKL
jgi:deazaflavin-dependent oxidoreductase (nitroreductase family)